MKRTILASTLLVAVSVLLSSRISSAAPQPQTAASQKQPATKLLQLLEESRYHYSKAAENMWVIPFEGKAIHQFRVYLSEQQELLSVLAMVVDKKDLNLSPEAMTKLLKLNNDMDRVKVGLDDENSIFVRVDVSSRVLDVDELRTNVEQVAAAANEVFAGLQPFMAARKP